MRGIWELSRGQYRWSEAVSGMRRRPRGRCEGGTGGRGRYKGFGTRDLALMPERSRESEGDPGDRTGLPGGTGLWRRPWS